MTGEGSGYPPPQPGERSDGGWVQHPTATLPPMAAPASAPTTVFTPRSSAIAEVEPAAAARSMAPMHFFFNMACSLRLNGDQDDHDYARHASIIDRVADPATG